MIFVWAQLYGGGLSRERGHGQWPGWECILASSVRTQRSLYTSLDISWLAPEVGHRQMGHRRKYLSIFYQRNKILNISICLRATSIFEPSPHSRCRLGSPLPLPVWLLYIVKVILYISVRCFLQKGSHSLPRCSDWRGGEMLGRPGACLAGRGELGETRNHPFRSRHLPSPLQMCKSCRLVHILGHLCGWLAFNTLARSKNSTEYMRNGMKPINICTSYINICRPN